MDKKEDNLNAHVRRIIKQKTFDLEEFSCRDITLELRRKSNGKEIIIKGIPLLNASKGIANISHSDVKAIVTQLQSQEEFKNYDIEKRTAKVKDHEVNYRVFVPKKSKTSADLPTTEVLDI